MKEIGRWQWRGDKLEIHYTKGRYVEEDSVVQCNIHWVDDDSFMVVEGLLPGMGMPDVKVYFKRLGDDARRTATSTDSAKCQLYTVWQGDTLDLIAQAFGVSAEAIRRMNNLKDDGLRVGQVLKIPRE